MNTCTIPLQSEPCEPAPTRRGLVWARGLALLPVLAAVLMLNACAVGNKYDYRILGMPLPVKGSGDIGLIVSDQRTYVRSGDKTPDFVGLQRGGYGNPFDVRTESGRPMAQDMTETLKGALEAQGFHVTLIDGDSANLAALGRQASERGLRRVVVLRIKEWKTDTMVSTKLFFDLQLLIIDPAGSIVAQNAITGSPAIGGGMPGAIGQIARQSFEAKIGQLFYPPEIRDALTGDSGGAKGGNKGSR